jgi:hypothetical protein
MRRAVGRRRCAPVRDPRPGVGVTLLRRGSTEKWLLGMLELRQAGDADASTQAAVYMRRGSAHVRQEAGQLSARQQGRDAAQVRAGLLLPVALVCAAGTAHGTQRPR